MLSKKQKNILLSCILFITAFFPACSDDESGWTGGSKETNESSEHEIIADETSPKLTEPVFQNQFIKGIWYNDITNQQWENSDLLQYGSFQEATIYCENLILGNFSDWRLPSISELRTLVRNCPATQTGGECNIIDTTGQVVALYEYIPNNFCYEPNCPYPNPSNTTGCYWPQNLKGSCQWSYWSSTTIPGNCNAWTLKYENGNIRAAQLCTNPHNSLYRCVRTP